MVVAFNPDIRAYSLLWYAITVLASVSMLIYLLISNKAKLNQYFWWVLLFNVWGSVSFFWALEPGNTLIFMKTAVAQMIFFIPLSMIIRNKDDFYKILNIVVFAILMAVVYLYFNIDRSILGQSRITEEGWNANSIGIMSSVAILLCLSIMQRSKSPSKSVFYFVVYWVAIVFLTYISLFTGSRKSLFILVFGVSLYYLITSKNNKVLTIAGTLSFISLFYYLVINVPGLYNVMGVRVEGLLAQITGKGNIDYSTYTRIEMVDYGFTWFKNNPLFGHGMNNYRSLYYSVTGLDTYSHNNYVELLVGVGIIGTAIYYYMHGFIIKQLYRSIRKEQIAALFFVMLLLLLILDYGMVSYFDSLMQLVICLGFVATRIVKEKRVT